MAARKGSADIPETDTSGDDLDGAEGTELAEDLDETSLDEAFADEDGDDDTAEDELAGADEAPESQDPTELTATPVDEDVDATQADLPAPAGASFDDEDADEEIVAAVTGEDEDPEIEGVRDGEFVCRSCFMAKRDTQLSDPERLLCRDCA